MQGCFAADTRCRTLKPPMREPGGGAGAIADPSSPSQARRYEGQVRRCPLPVDYGGQVRRRPLRDHNGLPPVPRGGKVSSLNRSRPTTQSRSASRRPPSRSGARKLPHDAPCFGSATSGTRASADSPAAEPPCIGAVGGLDRVSAALPPCILHQARSALHRPPCGHATLHPA